MQSLENKPFTSNVLMRIVSSRLSRVVIELILLSVLVSLSLWNLLTTRSGYIFLGNFYPPIGATQFMSFPFWDPYAYNGLPTMIPYTSLIFSFFKDIFLYPSFVLFGEASGSKIEIVLSIFLLFYSYRLLSKELGITWFPMLISSCFFLLNPLYMMLYINGEFQPFLFQSMMLFGLTSFLKSLREETVFNKQTGLASLLLAFSIAFLQDFLLGFLLFLSVPLITVFSADASEFRYKLRKYFLTLIVMTILTAALIFPYVLSVFFTGTNLTPNSIYAPSLSNFNSLSASFLSLIFLKSYGPNVAWTAMLSSYGPLMSSSWFIGEIVLLIIVLVSGLIFRNKALIFLMICVVISALFGSGSLSPIGVVNSFLYRHLVGYQALNASYYWDWILIVLYYSLSIGFLFDRLNVGFERDFKNKRGDKNIVFPEVPKQTRIRMIRIFSTLLLILLVFVIVTPFPTQEYQDHLYNKNSISFPPTFNELPNQLKQLVGANDTGVAFFNPDGYYYFNNSSQILSMNPIIEGYQFVRTANVPRYGSPQLQSSNFFFWAFQMFYENKTKYFAQLMSIEAIQYFVVFYNTNAANDYMPWSANKNASLLLNYQEDVTQIYQNSNFAIYKNLCNVSASDAVSNFTIVLGDYNTLNLMAYAGMNLSDLALVFGEDLNSTNWDFFMSHCSQIVSGESNLTTLAMMFINSSKIQPLDYVSNSLSSATQGWINSYRIFTYGPQFIQSALHSYAVTDGNRSLSLDLQTKNSGDYSIFFTYLQSSEYGGNMSVKIDNSTYSYDTKQIEGQFSNSYQWAIVNMHLRAGINKITFSSVNGWNSVGTVYLLNYTQLKQFKTLMGNITALKSQIIYVIGGGNLAIALNKSEYYYGSTENNLIQSGDFVRIRPISSLQASPFAHLKFYGQNGFISLELLSTAYSYFRISYGNHSYYFGISPGIYGNSQPWGWITVPINGYIGGQTVYLSLVYGSVFISQLDYFNVSPLQRSSHMYNVTFGNTTSTIFSEGISNFSYSVSSSTISGSFSYKNVTSSTIATIVISCKVPINKTILLSYNISGPAFVSMDSIIMSGFSGIDAVSISPALYVTQIGSGIDLVLNFIPFFHGNNSFFDVSFSIKLIGFTNDTNSGMQYQNNVLFHIPIVNSLYGYSLNSANASFILVREEFFYQMKPNHGSALSVADSLNTLLLESKSNQNLEVYNSSAALFYEGIVLSSLALGIFTICVYKRTNKRVSE